MRPALCWSPSTIDMRPLRGPRDVTRTQPTASTDDQPGMSGVFWRWRITLESPKMRSPVASSAANLSKLESRHSLPRVSHPR